MRAMREEEDAFDVPMTPLIDIVFLLLIFFLVATNFVRKEIDQKVKLPKAEGGAQSRVVPERLVINIRGDGTYVVNGRIVEAESLKPAIVEWHKASPGKPVSIRGDGGVPYAKVKFAMGVCGAVGVELIEMPHEEIPEGAAP